MASVSRLGAKRRQASTHRCPGPRSPDDRLDMAEEGLETLYGPTELHRSMLEVGRAELARYAEDSAPAVGKSASLGFTPRS